MEVRTAQEIHDGVDDHDRFETDLLGSSAAFITGPTSEWVRKTGVDGALYVRDALLLEVEEAIGTLYFIPKDGPYRDAAIRLQDRVRKHLEEAGLRAKKEKP